MLNIPNYIDKKFILNFIIIFIVVFNLFLILQNISNIIETFKISLGIREVFYLIYDFKNNFSIITFLIFILNNILIAYSFSAIIKLYKIEKNIFAKSSNLGIASIFAIIGAHCASCGSVLITAIFGSTIAYMLPFGGIEFSIISFLILIYLIYKLHKKLNNPYVCSS